LASLSMLSIAAPAPSSQSRHALLDSRGINDCGDSTFINQSSGGSPTVADCLQLAANIAGDGTWTVALLDQHQLAQYGTCAFGVQAGYYLNTFNYRVGNSDIIDIIHDSVNRFQWYGLVGATGKMPCQSDPFGYAGYTVDVTWGIYH
ncbi:putative necrosis-inducing factor-domain-containing protein, partial [Panaeolus papilionaceus]